MMMDGTQEKMMIIIMTVSVCNVLLQQIDNYRLRSNLSNLQSHLMSQGNNNNHFHHSEFVNHIHCGSGVTPGAPPLYSNYAFPHHFNDNGYNYHQHHGNNVTP